MDIEIPHGSWDHDILPYIVEITFNLDIGSTGKTPSIASNVGTVLVKKKVLMLRSRKTGTINNIDIYNTY